MQRDLNAARKKEREEKEDERIRKNQEYRDRVQADREAKTKLNRDRFEQQKAERAEQRQKDIKRREKSKTVRLQQKAKEKLKSIERSKNRIKSGGIRNLGPIDKEMGDATATRKMADNLGQVGAGLARVGTHSVIRVGKGLASIPARRAAAKAQRKQDVELGISKERKRDRLGRAVSTAASNAASSAKSGAKRAIRRGALATARAVGPRDKSKPTSEYRGKGVGRKDDVGKRDQAAANVQNLGREKGGALAVRQSSATGPVNRAKSELFTRSLAPERKALPAASEKGTYVGKKYTIGQGSRSSSSTPTGGGAGSLTRAVDKANNQRAAKRAQTTSPDDYASNAERKAAFKKRRAEQRAAGVKMREELIYEVEDMKKEKVDKVIDIMRGKNKIEVNPKVNESHLLVQDLADYKPLEIETIDLIKPEPLKASNWRNEISEEDKKIISINKGKRLDAKKQAFKDMIDEPYETDDKKRKEYGKKLLDRLTKVDEGAAWTKKEGKNKSGGLNEKGRKSYERENPGSDLKAPSKKVGNPRRKSFCARMRGMKKKLTSKKTASDPNSRINKSLRAWNC